MSDDLDSLLLDMEGDIGAIETVRHALFEVLERCGHLFPYHTAQVFAGELAGSIDGLREKYDRLLTLMRLARDPRVQKLGELIREDLAERERGQS